MPFNVDGKHDRERKQNMFKKPRGNADSVLVFDPVGQVFLGRDLIFLLKPFSSVEGTGLPFNSWLSFSALNICRGGFYNKVSLSNLIN